MGECLTGVSLGQHQQGHDPGHFRISGGNRFSGRLRCIGGARGFQKCRWPRRPRQKQQRYLYLFPPLYRGAVTVRLQCRRVTSGYMGAEATGGFQAG